jgi:hypothetical protein
VRVALGQVEAVARRQLGLEQRSSRLAAGGVHVPALAAVDLEDEHVVGVVVDAEPARSGRGDVGVDLDGVGQGELEVAGEADQRRPEAVQALQHDGGAGVELLEHQPRVGEIVHGPATHPSRPGIGPWVELPALLDRRKAGWRGVVEDRMWSTSPGSLPAGLAGVGIPAGAFRNQVRLA